MANDDCNKSSAALSDAILLPCPFCGSSDIRVFEDDHDDHYITHSCDTDDISVYVKYLTIHTEGQNSRQEAIAAWNRRIKSGSR